MVDRREQRKLETQQKLLNAAEQVFSELGYQAASILDITEAADVSKRTFYLHFNDKEAIIEALAMREFEKLRAQLEEMENIPDHLDETFRDGFHTMTRMIFEYAQNHPEIMQITFGQGGSFRLQAMARQFMAEGFEDNMVRKCYWKQDAAIPSAILGHAIAGLLHQLLCWWFRTPNDYTPDDMARMCACVLFDNIENNFDQELKRLHMQEHHGEKCIE